ncbi:hypothetical protein ACIGO6_06790 [Streptomyces sp. NPDC053750]|uniref:hypothetical protein n=1 Tax=Streptomyces sp. NPDC053750 TaxID=3365714 RepID=UPI0037D124AE
MPGEPTPDHLSPDPAGPCADRSRSGERRALDAMAVTFGVSLPRFALSRGGLPTLPTRPWAVGAH